jgi:hypothetical protein
MPSEALGAGDMIELNLRSSATRRSKPPPARYFGTKGVEASVVEISPQQQREQYAWALANSSGPGTPAPYGFNAKGKPIKKKRKKTRSKQKNLRKDTRSEDQKPGTANAAAVATESLEPALPPLDALLLRLHRQNPQHGAKRLTRAVRKSNPELATKTRQVRQALARVLQQKRSPASTAETAASLEHNQEDEAEPAEDSPCAEDAAAVAASVAKAVAAAEIWARDRSSSSGSDDELERSIVAATDAWSDSVRDAAERGSGGGSDGSDGSTVGWWTADEFREGGADHCDCRLPPTSGRASFCCVCGVSGHMRLECTAAPTQMPSEDMDYHRMIGGGRSSKRRSSGGERGGGGGSGPPWSKRKRPSLHQQIQDAARIPGSKRGEKSSAAAGHGQQKQQQQQQQQQQWKPKPRQKNGKAREEGARPKGGWAPKPKRTVFGAKKSIKKQRAAAGGGGGGGGRAGNQKNLSRKERRAVRGGKR